MTNGGTERRKNMGVEKEGRKADKIEEEKKRFLRVERERRSDRGEDADKRGGGIISHSLAA